MKRTILIAVGLILVIIGGVYLAQRNAPTTDTAAATSATSTSSASNEDTSGTTTQGTAVKPVPASGSMTLALGESASLDGIVVTPTKVVEDSRCPAGVYCIQAGTVRLEVSAQTPLGTVTRTVKLGDTVTLGSQKFTFSKVDPLKTQTPIDPTKYRFTVTVTQI